MPQNDEFITLDYAQEMIGYTRTRIVELIYEGKLWAINIASDLDARPCFRISKASALEVQQACRRSALRRQQRSNGLKIG
ncbi:MAG: hypothetical protein K9M45_05465 [Kiritimatiellales bacterium]|nr:hypothetical protein [Kiritimatiellales bacterium]